ncbi:hypothetical protein GCK32_014450 [Trichostrongylus colubriformis]|uniref:Leishmanolysin-like peptidase n=1 Tax=Trichostrongylus colubriformis TaxID=6319 RepID=A0AAN8EYA5_TRICO
MKQHRCKYSICSCSVNRLSKVRCNLRTDSRILPEEYNYNIKNIYRDKKGRKLSGYGAVELADFCPYYRVYGDVSREDSDTRCTYYGNMYYNNYSLEVFSPTARCFQLDGGISVESKHGKITWMHDVGCYETICKDNRLMIKTQNSKFYPCYQGGQFIHVEKRVYGVGTVTTRIVCPSCSELCGRDFCAPDEIVRDRIGDPTRITVQLKIQPILLTLSILFHIV